ncbi:putative exonuclease [Paenibacillus larvae subsp. larvae]|uniref:Putative exonuclease n=1 Tax=Paenibacillus larvae subsp. larvae TaxID=147375 RepID=A0A6C0QRJ3_9BACL|nr:putative exonuclease [Paenibacillus larvae subsp. larvae]
MQRRGLRHERPQGAASPDAPWLCSRRQAGPGTHSGPGADWEAIGAEIAFGDWGSFVLRRSVYPAGTFHGNCRLDRVMEEAVHLNGFLPGEVAASVPIRADRLLFFDTETTGLGVGAGNVPFMVGIGFYDGKRFIVEQLFIRNPAEEMAMLMYLQEKLARFTYIVSYNGRTFDWPILKNRFVLNRVPFDDSGLIQLDLLYPSRSLWKHTMASCKLGTVEEERLGFNRIADIPGSMAPALYFQYLADQDVDTLKGIFVHNEYDIVSLAALSLHFARLLSAQISLHSHSLEELYRLVIWLDKLGKDDEADEAADLLYERLTRDFVSGTLLLQGGALFKKRKEYERAVAVWQRYTEEKSHSLVMSADPFIELAMHYEHREKNYDLALRYAKEAQDKLRRRGKLSRVTAAMKKEEEQLQKRVERLHMKQKRGAERLSEHRDRKAKAISRHYDKNAVKPQYVSESLFSPDSESG